MAKLNQKHSSFCHNSLLLQTLAWNSIRSLQYKRTDFWNTQGWNPNLKGWIKMLLLNVNLLQNVHLHGLWILLGRVKMPIYNQVEPKVAVLNQMNPQNWGWRLWISLVILNRDESTTNWWGKLYDSLLIGVIKRNLHWIPVAIPPW